MSSEQDLYVATKFLFTLPATHSISAFSDRFFPCQHDSLPVYLLRASSQPRDNKATLIAAIGASAERLCHVPGFAYNRLICTQLASASHTSFIAERIFFPPELARVLFETSLRITVRYKVLFQLCGRDERPRLLLWVLYYTSSSSGSCLRFFECRPLGGEISRG